VGGDEVIELFGSELTFLHAGFYTTKTHRLTLTCDELAHSTIERRAVEVVI
jgi:hypothetical protein